MTKFTELCYQCRFNGCKYICEACGESIHENAILVTNFRLASEEELNKGCQNCKYGYLSQKMEPCKSCMNIFYKTGEWFSKWRNKNVEKT